MEYWNHEFEFRSGSEIDVVKRAVKALQTAGKFEDFVESESNGLAFSASGFLGNDAPSAIADVLKRASAEGADCEVFSTTSSEGEATDVTFYERGCMQQIVDTPYLFLQKSNALASLDAKSNLESAVTLSKGFASAEHDVEDCYEDGANLAALAFALDQTDYVPSPEEAEGWIQACEALNETDFSEPDIVERLLARAEAVATGEGK